MSQLLFKKCFFDAIRDGTKRTTLRRWTSARLKPGSSAFTPGVGWLLIESVEVVDLKTLTTADAVADGFTSLRAMRKMLAELYPDAANDRDGRAWFRMAFRFEGAQRAAANPPQGKSKPRKSRPTRSKRVPAADVDSQRRQLAAALRTSPPSKS